MKSLPLGRACLTPSLPETLPLGLELCERHLDDLLDDLLQVTRRRRAEQQAQRDELEDRLRRLRRVHPRFHKNSRGWEFVIGIPGFGSEPRRQVHRRGFPRKIDAATAARDFLKELESPLNEGVAELSTYLKTQGLRSAREMSAQEQLISSSRAAEAMSAISARRERERARFVYYVRRPDGAVKIGTTWNLDQRMQAFRNVSPVELLAVHSGGQVAEAALHRRFRHLRIDGEWFTADEDLTVWISHVISRAELRQGKHEHVSA